MARWDYLVGRSTTVDEVTHWLLSDLSGPVGWFPALAADGLGRLVVLPTRCPGGVPLSAMAISHLDWMERLACFNDRELTVRAVVACERLRSGREMPTGAPWIKQRVLCEVNQRWEVFGDEVTDLLGRQRRAVFELEMTGHFDDARSRDCSWPRGVRSEATAEMFCRVMFVLTSVTLSD